MTFISVDVESDGPIPGKYSMISFGAVVVEPELNRTFYGKLKPISDEWIPEALAVSGHTRDEVLKFESPGLVMTNFAEWLSEISRPLMFVADNNGYDFAFINWYFHTFLGRNPFGYSSTNLGSLYKGHIGNMRRNFRHLRKTKHTHNPVDDAKGNAEAMLAMAYKGIKGII